MSTPSNIPTPATIKKQVDKAKSAETKAANETAKKVENSPKPAAPKKPFKRPEHLTDRPLKNHEGLQNLQKKMNTASKKTVNQVKNFKRGRQK